MAEYKDKWEDNCDKPNKINGTLVQFYCDKACINCAICRENAPENFKKSPNANHSICFKQPESEKELANCNEAMICCPVNAIGNFKKNPKD